MRSLLTILYLFASSAHAVPGQFTHQGRILNDDGTPITGEATITFRVINAETGGVILWKETQTITLTNGFYATVLGAEEDENPLDTSVLQQAPVWLELQLADKGAMYPRNPIHAVPYATISTVASSVSGGPVDATEIAVNGTPVVDDAGNWVGAAPTIGWDDIDGKPDDAFDALAVSCEAGDIPVLDAGSGMWVCGWDNDSLADIACTEGQLIQWSNDAVGFVCADDVDTVLTADQVDAIVADRGYAMAADVFSGSYGDLSDKPTLFSGSFEDLSDVPDWILDADYNDGLTAEEVDAILDDKGYAMATDVFSGSFFDITDMPTGLSDGIDNDSLGDLPCGDEQVAAFDAEDETWKCTSLSSLQPPAVIEPIPALTAGNSINLREGIFGGGFRTSVQTFTPTTSGTYTTLQLMPVTFSGSGSDTDVAIYGPSPDGSVAHAICSTTLSLGPEDEGAVASIDMGLCNLTAGKVHYIGIFDTSYGTDFYGNESPNNQLVAWQTDNYRTFIPSSLDLNSKVYSRGIFWFRLLP